MAAPAWAQWKPTKPINLIVPWAAGGSTDRHMRTLAEIDADGEYDLATLSVAARQIRNMTRTRTGSNT